MKPTRVNGNALRTVVETERSDKKIPVDFEALSVCGKTHLRRYCLFGSNGEELSLWLDGEGTSHRILQISGGGDNNNNKTMNNRRIRTCPHRLRDPPQRFDQTG